MRALLKPVACAAATLFFSSVLLAQERLPITFRNQPAFVPTPISRAHVTFPDTSAAPIRWKTPVGVAHLMSHIDDVEHTSSAAFADSADTDQEIQPVAFTLQLDPPKNGSSNGVKTVAGTTRRTPAAAASQGESVLSSRRGSPRPARPMKSPLVDQAPAQPADGAEPPALLSPAADDDLSVIAEEEKGGAVRIGDPPPPQPVDDPEDAAPTPPATLQQRATPQLTQQPIERPELRDPAQVAQPPVGGVKKRRCSDPNDRDCCADEEVCDDRLARIQADKLIRFGKEALDITPRYMPGEKPEEHARNEERKAQQLTLAGKREWQDKSGRAVAEGKLVDIVLGKAIIETDSGEQVEVKLLTLSDDDLCFIAAWYNLPTECTLGSEEFQGRQFIASTMTWKASGVCHKPLYFEDVQLERYGHTMGPIVQPFVSGAHFFVNVALVPYKMGINPPNECQYPLGYYRPGSCAPWMLQPFPLSARGAATATGFYTGANFLIP